MKCVARLPSSLVLVAASQWTDETIRSSRFARQAKAELKAGWEEWKTWAKLEEIP
jgi:hypothetical protein